MGESLLGMKHSLWDKTIPRLVAACAFAYLIYALVWKGESLSYLHVLVFLLVVVLVLIPFAHRLKIPNVIEFESKLESLRGETKKELGDIRNQISNVIDMRVSPAQYQTNILNLGEMTELTKVLESLKQPHITVSPIDKKAPEHTREDFLSKAEIRRGRAFTVLVIAREFQEAILEHKAIDTKVVFEGTIDEKIRHMSKTLLDRGVKVLFPFVIVGENGDQVPVSISEITEGLQLIDSFLDIRQKVENQEIIVPHDADELLNNIEKAILNIKAAVIVLGTNLIVSDYNLQRKLIELQKWLDTEIKEETEKS